MPLVVVVGGCEFECEFCLMGNLWQVVHPSWLGRLNFSIVLAELMSLNTVYT